MKKDFTFISRMILLLGVFCISFRLTEKYLHKCRRKYITIENEHVNV